MYKSLLVSSLIFITVFLTATTSAWAVKTGDPVPSFRARTLLGDRMVGPEDIQGKVVFIDFWASWCPPCLKSLPDFEQLRSAYSKDDVAILAINVDEDPELAKQFLRKIDVSYTILADQKGIVPEAFGVQTMPSSFLIDQSGVVRYVHRGYKSGDVQKIRAHIDQLLTN